MDGIERLHQHIGPRGTVTCDMMHPEPPADLVPRGARCEFCNHRQHDPGSCHERACGCEVHTDTALAWVLRDDPDLVAQMLHRAEINCNPWTGGADTGSHARLHRADVDALLVALDKLP